MEVLVVPWALSLVAMAVPAEQQEPMGLQAVLVVPAKPQQLLPEVAAEVPQVMQVWEELVVPLLRAQVDQEAQLTPHLILEDPVARFKPDRLSGIQVPHQAAAVVAQDPPEQAWLAVPGQPDRLF
jgi:hypothetical protein